MDGGIIGYMIPRELETVVQSVSRYYPVLCLTGPRQSGKTTLLKKLYPDRPYRSLEDPDVLEFCRSDPRGFLDTGLREGLVIDEAQRHPPLFNYLQGYADRSGPGAWVVSGSHNFLPMQSIGQSLAGRAGILKLMALSGMELGARLDEADWESAAFRGFYPRVRAEGMPPELFAKDYLATYAERDVRLLRNIHALPDFQRFLRLAAGRAGQLLNLASLSQDAGLSVATVRDWLGLLEASYLIYLLRPWNESFNKRLVKSPKLYWLDTGLLCRLLDARSPEDLSTHPLRGAVFENLLVADRVKRAFHRGEEPSLGFWRESNGLEIDLVEAGPEGMILWEAKAGRTVASDFLRPLEVVGELASVPAKRRILVYGGDEVQSRSAGLVLGWKAALGAAW